MKKETLESIVTAGMRTVVPSSRDAGKFTALTKDLAGELGVSPELLAVKALTDAKNYGNRISEATGSKLEWLVLVAAQRVDRVAVRNALTARSLFRTPTLVFESAGGEWRCDAVFIPEESAGPTVEGANVETFPRIERSETPSESTEELVRLVRALEGGPLDSFDSLAATSSASLVAKVVSGPKNLQNRIREGFGQRAQFFVVRVPSPLRSGALRVLSELGDLGTTTRVFLAVEVEGLLKIEEVPRGKPSSYMSMEKDEAASSPRESAIAEPEATYGPLVYRRLERVNQLRRHLPFDADAAELYEEHFQNTERGAYETRTLTYLRGLLAGSDRVVVVLTGNAGHGKTHLCRRLLQGGDATVDVMTRMKADLRGVVRWSVEGASLPVRVVKDLSEITPPEAAASLLDELLTQVDSHVILCANEGRLRDVAAHAPAALGVLLEGLEQGLTSGTTAPTGRSDVHVVNLNLQSATGRAGDSQQPGFLSHALDQFLNHQGAWRVCGTCAASDRCPIYANRNELGISPSLPKENIQHRETVIDLVRTVEESGYVLTFRESLIFAAYVTTGTLTCREVEELHRRNDNRRLEAARLTSLLFEPNLGEDASKVLKVLGAIHKHDPGRIALRPVDERMHAELETEDALGASVFGDGSAQLTRAREIKSEADDHRTKVRRARRKAWLTASDDTDGVLRSRRLGLRHHHRFRALQLDPSDATRIDTLRALVRGLHTIQGAVGVDSKSNLHLVDPAFGRSGSHAAVIARSVRIRDLEVYTESQWWTKQSADSSTQPPVLTAVEWIDRRVLLVNPKERVIVLSLDLAEFEFVMNAGEGIVMREFHSAQRRRILRCLALAAESGQRSDSEIRVVLERGEGVLTVERDGTILLERSS